MNQTEVMRRETTQYEGKRLMANLSVQMRAVKSTGHFLRCNPPTVRNVLRQTGRLQLHTSACRLRCCTWCTD